MLVDDKYYLIGSFTILSAHEMKSIDRIEKLDKSKIDHAEIMLCDKNPVIIKNLKKDYFDYETTSPPAIEENWGELG